jgi:hypothetical protein
MQVLNEKKQNKQKETIIIIKVFTYNTRKLFEKQKKIITLTL